MAKGLIQAFILHAQRAPDRVAVHEIGGPSWSRSDILLSAQATAQMLDRHVPRGAVVMLCGPGGGRYWAGLIAILGTGRRALPVGQYLPEHEQIQLAEAQGVDAILETDPDTPPIAGQKARFHQPVAESRSIESITLDRGADASLLLRSSGTTGLPAVSLRSGQALDRVAATLVDVLELTEEDRIFAALPMQHAYGIEHAVFAPMLAGTELAWQPSFDLSSSAEELRQRATIFAAVPVTLEAAARLGTCDAPLRLAYTAGSTLPDSVRESFANAWSVPLGDLYGATELGTITWGVGGDSRAVPGVSIRVRAQDGSLSTSGVGELLVQSDAMFEGYILDCNEEINPGDRIEGHFRTGDLAQLHTDGRVEITGRLKAQFDVAGLKVNPTEVESVLNGYPGVQEIVVVPLSLSETVTRVRAVVVPGEGSEESIREGLIEYAAKFLAPHLRPRIIDFQQSLPRTPSGKILRHLLLESSDEQRANHSGRSTSV